jgi:glycosyltransferase involved in cell wall biosynthesis
LAAAGHRVLVLAADSNRPKPESNWAGYPPGVEVHYYRKSNSWMKSFYFDYSLKEIRTFFEAHHGEIDLIHLAQTRCLPNIGALEASRLYDIPIAMSSFGSLPRRGGIGKWMYDQFFVHPLVNRASLLLAQTDHECQVYADYGGRRESIRLLPLAVDVKSKPALPPDVRDQFFRKFGIPAGSHLFLFLGRLHPTKGVSFLVRAFALVRSEESRAFLALVGHDEGCAEEARALAEKLGVADSVKLCGPLYDADRWQSYQSADTFVISPNVYEETSLASIEALSCGTPVITNECADIPWLHDYQAGIVTRPGDESAFSSAMLQLLREDAEAKARRRVSASRLVEERFEISAVSRRLAEFAGEVGTGAKAGS